MTTFFYPFLLFFLSVFPFSLLLLSLSLVHLSCALALSVRLIPLLCFFAFIPPEDFHFSDLRFYTDFLCRAKHFRFPVSCCTSPALPSAESKCSGEFSAQHSSFFHPFPFLFFRFLFPTLSYVYYNTKEEVKRKPVPVRHNYVYFRF